MLQPLRFEGPLLSLRLQGLGDGGPAAMSLEKWSWFLVQVQNEERGLGGKDGYLVPEV